MTRWIKLQKHAQNLQDQTHSAEWPPILFHKTLLVSLLTFPLTFSEGICCYHISSSEPHTQGDRLSFFTLSAVESISRSREQIFFHLQIPSLSLLYVFVCAHFFLLNLQNCRFRSCRFSLLLELFFPHSSLHLPFKYYTALVNNRILLELSFKSCSKTLVHC